MGTKLTFAGQSRAIANTIATLDHDLEAMDTVYFDRGYDSSGSDPIVDGDVSELDLTAADLAGMVTIAQQFRNFLNNLSVTAGDYNSTVSNTRSDF